MDLVLAELGGLFSRAEEAFHWPDVHIIKPQNVVPENQGQDS